MSRREYKQDWDKNKKRKSRSRKNRKRRVRLIIICLLFVTAIAVTAGFMLYDYNNRVYKTNVVEAGAEVTAEDFLKDKSKNAEFADENAVIDTSKPGEYSVKIKSWIYTYECTLRVQDTVPPVATTAPISITLGESVAARDFVTDIQDCTEVQVSYKAEPDFSGLETQSVTIVLTDMGNNTSEYTETLNVKYVKEQLDIKYGDGIPDAKEFLYADVNAPVQWTSDVSKIDTTVLGKYDLNLKVGENEYATSLRVMDVIPPVVAFKDSVSAYFTSELKAEDFVENASDETEIKYSIESEIDYSAESQSVTIAVTDEGGNRTEGCVTLLMKKDTEPPKINGVRNLYSYIGGNVSYRTGVTVTDNCDKDIGLNVDNSSVNLNAEGSYNIVYTATDRQGNTVTQTATLTIMPYTEELVYAKADEILSRIINDGMSPYEKLQAIYKWIKGNVWYVDSSDKSDWIKAAYEGLELKKGDCFVYACTSKVLLTRAGIKNKDIMTAPNSSNLHYWNLVDIGEGWYHFDTTPRQIPLNGCYVSDAYLMDYSNKYGRTHTYDKSLYPDIK